MNQKPNLLDQAFDHLSSFPFLNLRKVCKGMWVYSTVLFGISILAEGVAIFTGKMDFRHEWVKNLLLWAGVNPLFAYTLYLWRIREQSVKS